MSGRESYNNALVMATIIFAITLLTLIYFNKEWILGMIRHLFG